MTQSATTIYNESLAARSTQIGATNTAPPYLENHQAPVAIRSHYEYFEVCNMNKGVMVLEISCWRWRPGRDYQGGSLENEVILSKDEGTGKILYSKADPPLGYVSWKGVPVPEQRHEYPVGVTGTVTGFGVESFFLHEEASLTLNFARGFGRGLCICLRVVPISLRSLFRGFGLCLRKMLLLFNI